MSRLTLALLWIALPVCALDWVVVVAGLGGSPEYEQRFSQWAAELAEAIKTAQGATDVEVTVLSGGQATAQNFRQLLATQSQRLKPEDRCVVMLIGHGSYDGYEYKFNLRGPDLSAQQLRQLFDQLPCRRQLVVNMTSASGASLAAWQRPGRAVITATRSGHERNAVVFPRFWVAALKDPAADGDKNRVISALEAFRYAQRKTEEFYRSQQRLATEHPLLEDTGQGEGVRDPSPENGRGLLAAEFALVRLEPQRQLVYTPRKRELLAKKEQLEQEIDRLKYQKAAMPEQEYRQKLTALLVELARTQQALEEEP